MGSINSFGHLHDAVTGGDHIYLEGDSLRREERGGFSRMGEAVSRVLGGGPSKDEEIRLAKKVRELIDRDIQLIERGNPIKEYDRLERIYTVLERLELFGVEEGQQPIFADVRSELFNLGQIRDLKRILRGRGKNLALIGAIRRGDIPGSLVLINRLDPSKFMKGEKDLGITPLHEACFCGPVAVAREIIRKLGSKDLGNTVTNQESTALHVACLKGHREIVKELITRMDPEDLAKVNSQGFRALDFACQEGYVDIVKDLIERMRPEDLGRVNTEGNTILHWASMGRHGVIISELLKKMRPEDIGKVDNRGNTMIHYIPVLLIPRFFDALGQEKFLRVYSFLPQDAKDIALGALNEEQRNIVYRRADDNLKHFKD